MSWKKIDPNKYLEGYLKAKTPVPDTYFPYVPDTAYSDFWGSSGNRSLFNVSRLPQTDIIDILTNRYDRSYQLSVMDAGMAKITDIRSVVASLEKNIVALSYRKGEPFGTGLLIHPRYVLTARHCLEEHDLKEIVILTNYQKSIENIMDFGEAVLIDCLVEHNVTHDFAIIRLVTPIESFVELPLSFQNYHSNSTLLLHHPRGGPKKASIHASLTSVNAMLNYAGFHDSQKGSSGGVYINAEGKVFALHCLNIRGVTSAKLIAEIVGCSDIWKQILFEHNVYYYPITYPLHKTYRSTPYLETIEDKPVGYPNVNAGRLGRKSLTYHHIIPKGDMEFLWMLGKEYPSIDKILKKIVWQENHFDDHGRLMVNAVIWSPWDIFIGPSDRPHSHQGMRGYDPGDKLEPSKPLSFSKYVWADLNTLYLRIQQCWTARTEISRKTREETIHALDILSYQGTLGDPPTVTMLKVHLFAKYSTALADLEQALINVSKTIKKYPPPPPEKFYWTINNDWTQIMHNGQEVYKLRQTSHDGIPVHGVI